MGIEDIETARHHALSGKLDRVLTRLENVEKEFNNVKARLAHLALPDLHSHLKLGKGNKKHDKRNLLVENYTSSLAAPPSTCDYSVGDINYGMMLNDELGLCTMAGAAHAIQTWTGGMRRLPDCVVLDYYEKWAGYVLGRADTDQGAVELDILNNWRKFGFGFRSNKQGADKLLAYAAINPRNELAVKNSIFLFGGSYLGIELPLSAQSQSTWSVIEGETALLGSWGGHCVYAVGYTLNYVLFISWGKLMRMTWEFFFTYVSEAYALLSPDFLCVNGLSPHGFDLAALMVDLHEVTR